MITHSGTLQDHSSFYPRLKGKLSKKEFRVALKTTGCCYVVRNKVLLDEEMFARFKAKMSGGMTDVREPSTEC